MVISYGLWISPKCYTWVLQEWGVRQGRLSQLEDKQSWPFTLDVPIMALDRARIVRPKM